jgi:nicotinate-nucleotide pyrophosphorylase (carboxylating)
MHNSELKGRTVLLEASGGITLENIGAVAETEVDRISIGALTHSAPVLDLSMEMG